MTATRFKLPYEPPKILDLGGGVAYAAALCHAGSVAQTAKCQAGGSPHKKCQTAKCQAGGSPQKECHAGSVAYGCCCMAGSVAGAKCTPGSAPQK